MTAQDAINEHPFAYFKAEGASLVLLEKIQVEYERRNALGAALTKEVGAEACVHQNFVVGFIFPGDAAPPSWTKAGGIERRGSVRPFFAPDRRSSVNKALHVRMKEIRPNCQDLYDKLFPEGSMVPSKPVYVSNAAPWRSFGLRYIGKDQYFEVPVPWDGKRYDESKLWHPEGCTRISSSEYFKLLENVSA